MADLDPVIVFGAFDRHNFGDLLFAHISNELLKPVPVIFAGLAERDLTSHGGHRVRAIADLAREWGDRPANLVHAGGEILTCSLYEAAIMVQTPAAARAAIARLYDGPEAQLAWAQEQLGLGQQLGYLVPKTLFRNPRRFVHQAVGGADLERLPDALQAEVWARLGESDHVSVRDHVTQACLARRGIPAELVPDPAMLTAELFGSVIARHGGCGEPSEVCASFPQGYVAVQFSADFGDDATLHDLARQLAEVATHTGLGIVPFRAGAAPWHDDLEVYRRLRGFMSGTPVRVFESLHLWDICALLANARAYCGSSLHGRIVAEAFGVPGVHLQRPGQIPGKLAAYAGTWSAQVAAAIAGTGELAPRLEAVDADLVRNSQGMQAQLARQAAEACLAAFRG